MKRISAALASAPKRLQLSGNMPRNSPFFDRFASSATILPFSPTAFPPPTRESSYNDDVSIPHYEGASRTFADKQRKGVCGDIPVASSVYRHVEFACQLPFFLAQAIPLPPSSTRAQLSPAECGRFGIAAFWGKQIERLEKLVVSSDPVEAIWASQIPPPILPAAGKLRASPFLSLMGRANLGGRLWMKQLIFASPLVGELSQRHTYPDSRKEVSPPLRRPEIFAGN